MNPLELQDGRGVAGAVWFYVLHVVLVMAGAMLSGAFAGGVVGALGETASVTPYQAGWIAGFVVTVLYLLGLGFLLLARKGRLTQPGFVLLVLASGGVGLWGGGLLGLIPLAFLSTRSPRDATRGEPVGSSQRLSRLREDVGTP